MRSIPAINDCGKRHLLHPLTNKPYKEEVSDPWLTCDVKDCFFAYCDLHRHEPHLQLQVVSFRNVVNGIKQRTKLTMSDRKTACCRCRIMVTCITSSPWT